MPTQKPQPTRASRRRGPIPDPYQLLFEANPHPMWVYDLETLAFLAVNDTAVRRYGYSREEFLGMTIKNIRPPEDVPALLENVAQVSEGLDEAGVWRHRTKDGTLIEVEIVSHTLTFVDRKAELVLAQDVTDRRRMERTLREGEQRLATLFRSVPDMVGIVSVAEGRYLDVNDGYGRILGYARDELIGRTIHELGIWADALPRATLVEALTRDGAVRNWEIQYRTKAGRVIIGLVSAELIDYAGVPCVLSVTRDVTERAHAETALRESEAKLRSIFRAAPVGVGMVVHRVLKAANQRLCEMVGYAEDELVNQSARLLYPTDEDFAFVGREKYTQIETTGVGTVETRWRRKDGALLDVLLSSAPMEPDNWGAGVIFTALDITDRKRAAEERQRLEEQMRHAQKLESLGVLAGGIAHDFNNLLMAILGNADLALADAPARLPGPAAPSGDRASVTPRRGPVPTDAGLLRQGPLRRRAPRPLRRWSGRWPTCWRCRSPRGPPSEYRFASGLPAVEADATQLRQIVMNLDHQRVGGLGRSARRHHASRPGRGVSLGPSCARVSWGPISPRANTCTSRWPTPAAAWMPQTRKRIFDPFFTTKFTGGPRAGGGAGDRARPRRRHPRAKRARRRAPRSPCSFRRSPASSARRRAAPALHADWQGRGHGAAGGRRGGGADRRGADARMVGVPGADRRRRRRGARGVPAARRRHRVRAPRPDHAGPERRRDVRRAASRVAAMSGWSSPAATMRTRSRSRFEGHGPAGFIQKPYTMEALRDALRRALQ